MRISLLFCCWLAACSVVYSASPAVVAPGTSPLGSTVPAVSITEEVEQVGGGLNVTIINSEATVDVEKQVWSKPAPLLILVALLLAAALVAPFVVPYCIRYFIAPATTGDKDIGTSDASYGTFAPTVTRGQSTQADEKGEHLTIAAGTNVVRADLPPKIEIKWDRSLWKLVHKNMDKPVGFAVSAALISVAVSILNLPRVVDEWHVRSTALTVVRIIVIVAIIFALHRAVNLLIEFIGRQSWLMRTKMTDLYKEIASRVGLVVKILGATIIIISVIGISSHGWKFKIFFAFMTAVALGFCGWILLELSDVAEELFSSAQLMYYNMFKVGDFVEFYLRDHGSVQGRLMNSNTRNSELFYNGRPVHVPNSVFLKACVINHSRSTKVLRVEVFVSPLSDTQKLREFANEIRNIIARADYVDAEYKSDQTVSFCGPVSGAYLALAICVTVIDSADHNEIKDRLMLQVIALGQSLGIQFRN